MKPMTQKPKVGDVIIYIAESNGEFVQGEQYTIVSIDSDGEPELYDANGDKTYLEPYEYRNFSLKDDIENPGMILMSGDFGVDTTGTITIEVTVDKLGLDTIRKLSRDSERYEKREAIKKQIAELEEEIERDIRETIM